MVQMQHIGAWYINSAIQVHLTTPQNIVLAEQLPHHQLSIDKINLWDRTRAVFAINKTEVASSAV